MVGLGCVGLWLILVVVGAEGCVGAIAVSAVEGTMDKWYGSVVRTDWGTTEHASCRVI